MEVLAASTNEEKQRIYRFRYDVYIEELGEYHSCADHESKTVEDVFDSTGRHFFVEDEIGIVAAIRMNFKRDGPIEFEEEYQMDRFIPWYPMQVSSISRLLVRKDRRNSRIVMDLFFYLYEYGLDNGTFADFINCSEPLDKMYETIGYRRYIPPFIHPVYGLVIPMVHLTHDFSHLQKTPLKSLITDKYQFQNHIACYPPRLFCITYIDTHKSICR